MFSKAVHGLVHALAVWARRWAGGRLFHAPVVWESLWETLWSTPEAFRNPPPDAGIGKEKGVVKMEEVRKQFHLKIKPSVLEKVEHVYQDAGCKTRADFIEKAIEFYCGYLSSEKDQSYLPGAVVAALQGSLSQLERGICLQLHKVAVELYAVENLMVVASAGDVTLDQLHKLRKRANAAVRESHGVLSLIDAYKYQNGEDS